VNAAAHTALTMPPAGLAVAVTGAAQGIGLGLARHFAQAGARVLLSDLHGAACAAARDALRAEGHVVEAVTTDVTDAAACAAMVAAAVDAYGRLDLMVCNAGVAQVKPFMELQAADWDLHFAVNVKGAFLSLQAAARQMKTQEPLAAGRPRGKIITMASIAARYGAGVMAPYQGPYRASKAAVVSLTQTAAYTLSPDITVNALCPGIVATDMWTRMDRDLAQLNNGREGDVFASRVANVPMGRAQTPQDVAGLALFLASPASDYMTGQAINIDGGLVLS
jgi:meso-butanediol dehydrogenase/(S,S)-butanediol dehydrogenase/diacetyl reductase